MNKKAFTLVELLAVIVILGIILLIAIPSVTKIVTEAKKDTLVSSAKLIEKAVKTDGTLNKSSVYRLGEDGVLCRLKDDVCTSINYKGKLVALNGTATLIITGNNVIISDGIVCENTSSWCIDVRIPISQITTTDVVADEDATNSDFAIVPNTCFTYTTANDQITITGYTISKTCPSNPIIPSSIENVPVAYIGIVGQTGIDGFMDLTAVKIPSSVLEIYDGTFWSADNLAKLELSEGLEVIGNSAFEYTNISTVIIPNSVRFIGQMAFDVSNISSLTLGTGLDCPNGEYTYERNNCHLLLEGDPSIGGGSFTNNKITTLSIPAGIEYRNISNGAFDKEKLTTVTIYGDNPNRFDAVWSDYFGNAQKIIP